MAETIAGELLILQISEFLDNGDGCHRFHGPCRALARCPGVVAIDCDLYHRFLPELLQAADVLILHGFDWELFPMIEERRAAGGVTVLEANDYYMDIQPWNSRAGMWLDRGTQEELRQCMAAVDAVQTSTPELARRWQPWARKVAVFPNHLEAVEPLPERPSRPLTIGWGGSSGHFADWYYVAPVVEAFVASHPEARLSVMANEAARDFIHLPADRYEFRSFASLVHYQRFLKGLDIGLAPLLPTDFNRGRSDVKYLEYAAAGAAGIYADLEPYRQSVTDGETGLFYRTLEEFRARLEQLADDEALRGRIRQLANERVTRKRLLADHILERLNFYRELLPGPAHGAALREEIVQCAQRDGRYLQLRAGAPEQALAGSRNARTPAEAAEALARLAAGNPRYVPALQQLGKVLNDGREPQKAQGYLEQALSLEPRSARTLSELGRARFLQNDPASARKHLEQALALNPHYQLGWQYLLRLLAARLDPDSAQWADKALELFPGSWSMGLHAARVYRGQAAVASLERWFDRHAPMLSADELPLAAAAFSEAAQELTGAEPAALELYVRAALRFSDSARLATLLAGALARAGRHQESQHQLARALALRRQASTYQMEYRNEDLSVLYWQMGEHIEKWRDKS